MIPKTVWKIWISDKPCPEYFKQYTDSWEKIMPDYTFMHIFLADAIWMSKDSPVLKKLIEEKRWALVNHYVRYLLLYHNGGLYFDLDIEIVKPFDDLLDMQFIIGREDQTWISNAVMGCTPKFPIMKELIEMMDNFDYSEEQAELKTGVQLPTKIINRHNGKVLPPVYFFPYLYTEKFTPECIKPETHAVHHWAASWTDKPKHNEVSNG